jgi:apolipoprotein N-acyltransferase
MRKKALLALPVLLLLHVLCDYKVAPFPLVVLLIFAVYQSLQQLAVYGADRWVTGKMGRFAGTLFFPSVCVALEFFNTVYGGGIWWSVANSQYPFPWLVQLASVTGMWGISFLLYWGASVVVWAIGRWRQQEGYRSGLAIYGGVLAVVLVFGCVRYSLPAGGEQRTVRAAGVTVPLKGLLETIYKVYSGREMVLDPRASVTDPALRLVGQAEASYVESADTVKYKSAFAAMNRVNDSLFVLSQAAADSGARVICWSEGNAVGFKADEDGLVERGKRFAAGNKLYMLMGVCIVHPGKITPGKKYLENEAILVGPEGSILARYHKNNPVPMVEASEPGDGVVPVVETPYGRIAVSICYDADFPLQMRQLDRKRAGLLLLPSGDWFSISPFHTYMAVYRGIENGCSVLREVTSGLSLGVDYRGRRAGGLDYFREGTKLWVADLPVGHRDTIYSRIGDVLAYGCILLTVLMPLSLLFFTTRWKAVPLVKDRMVLQP